MPEPEEPLREMPKKKIKTPAKKIKEKTPERTKPKKKKLSEMWLLQDPPEGDDEIDVLKKMSSTELKVKMKGLQMLEEVSKVENTEEIATGIVLLVNDQNGQIQEKALIALKSRYWTMKWAFKPHVPQLVITLTRYLSSERAEVKKQATLIL